MHIWIISDGEPLPTDDKEVRLRRMGNLARILSSRNHKVSWITSNFEHYTKRFRSNDDHIITLKSNYRIVLFSTKGYKKNVSLARMRHYNTLVKKFRKFVQKEEKPDIILCTMAPIELGKEVKKYCIENNVKYVIDIRDLWPDVYYEVTPKATHLLVKILVEKTRRNLKGVLKNSNGIVAVTNKFLDYGLNIANMKKRDTDIVVHTAYPGSNIFDNKNDFDAFWQQYNISSSDFIVTFVGNFGQQFDLDTVKETIDKLSNENIKFVLCGTGERLSFFKDYYKNNSNVILPGWVNANEISSLLTNSDVGIAPYINSKNYQWNYPNKFGEYLSAGLPVMVSVEGLMSEFVLNNECGNYYKNSDELAKNIMRYFNNKKLQKTHSKNARKEFELNFDSKKVYNDFSDYLEKTSDL